VKVLAFLARLLGALLALIVDARRVKCRNHYLEPMTEPRRCMTCWQTL
jgi:hypothetical protein